MKGVKIKMAASERTDVCGRIARLSAFGCAAFSAFQVFFGCDVLPTAELDKGGVTFDFPALSAQRFRIPKAGEGGNLVAADAEWKAGSGEVHRAGLSADDLLRKEFCKNVTFTEKDGVREICNGAGLLKVKAPWENAYQVVSGSWKLRVPLPDAKGGYYRVTCRYQQRHNAPHSRFRGGILMWFEGVLPDGKRGRTEEGRYNVWQFSDIWGDWGLFDKTFKVEKGTDTLDIRMRVDGVADLKFTDFGISRFVADKPLSVKLTPHGLLDGTFALGEGQASMVAYAWKKSDPKAEYSAGKFVFTLRLPPGLEYLGDSFADPKTRKVEKAADGSTVVRCSPKATYKPRMTYTSWSKLTVLVRCDRPAPWRGEGVMELAYDGKPVSDPERTTFFAVGPVRAAAVPERYRNGLIFAGRPHEFCSDEAEKAFARTMVAAGVRWVTSQNCAGKRAAMWHEAGIPVVTLYADIANGYYMGSPAGRPEEDRFVSDGKEDAKYRKYISRSTCPRAVYEQRPYFLTNTVAKMKKALEGTDGMWANWEPYMFRRHGCCCSGCKAAFEKWKAETGGTLEKFRSIQHGRLVKTIDKHVRAATGGEKSFGFIPGIHWREVASPWREKHPSIEAEPIDYAGDLRWIEPWGPYVYWDATTPYNPVRHDPPAHFVAARDMRAAVDVDYPAPRRPKLLSFPHGVQSAGWVTQPEWLEMACDSFFFNGFEANMVYFFPEGYDARYWKAFADATARAARYESFVVGGRRADADTELAVVAEYAPTCAYVKSFLTNCRDVPMLQQATWVKGDERIVAVFNFWNDGEAFFNLKARGLAPGKYLLSDEDGVLYSPGRFAKAWTADELASGDVMLCVGAARTKVFTISPEGSDGAPCASRATADDIASLYAAARDRLAACRKKIVSAEQGR